MKFKSPIEVKSSIKDYGNSPGSAGQVLTSTGSGVDWVDQGAIAVGSAEVVEVPVKNTHTATILKGTPVYISGSVGSSGRLEVKPANASVEASMPALGLLKQDLAVNAEGFCVISGKLRNLITSPIDGATTNEGDVVYVKAGGGLTTTKPVGVSNLIQNMGKVGVSSTSNNGTFVVSSILRSNDVPNLPKGRLFVGTSGNTSLTSDVVYIDDANDRVGIGTTSPNAKLHVTGEVRAYDSSNTYYANLNANSSWGYFNTNAAKIYINKEVQVDTGLIGSYNEDLQLRTEGSTKMYIKKDNGNVGIGTTNPSAKLHIQNGSSGQAYTLLSGALIDVNGTSNSYSALRVGSSAGSNHLVVTNAGNVGIGVTSPQGKLDVNGNIRLQGNNQIDLGGTGLIPYWQIGVSNTTNNLLIGGNAYYPGSRDILLNPSSNGKVGIGTTDPSEKLHVEGNILVSNRLDANQVRVDSTSSSAGVVLNSSGDGSHIRFKNNGAETDAYVQTRGGHVGIGGKLGHSTNNINIRKSDGFLGIKQRNPLAPLHIKRNGEAIRLECFGDNQSSIDFWQETTDDPLLKKGHIEFDNATDTIEIKAMKPSGSQSKIKFSVALQDQEATEVMRIQKHMLTGNNQVVIGSPGDIPSSRELYVLGEVHTTGPLNVFEGGLSVGGRVDADTFKVKGLNSAPASSTAAGNLGEIRFTASHIYLCVGGNKWKRVALSNF